MGKMLRIVALNEEIGDGELEEEVQVTKEAQAAIAESEYIRAIKFKAAGNSAAALILFNELLETKVLNEISDEVENEKLWLMRYNCHKNIAIIYEETGKSALALDHYLLAMQIDDSDVYTMHRFGQLALKWNALELAETAFDKCLARNPTHWKAADGILQTLCRNHNILGAYGWALNMYRRNPKYSRAIRTLQEIAKTFEHSLPYFEKFFRTPFPLDDILGIELPTGDHDEEAVFPQPALCEEISASAKTTFKASASLNQFRLRSLDWLSVGQYILSIYRHLKETEQNLFFTLSLVDMIHTPGEETKKSSFSPHSSYTKSGDEEPNATDLSPTDSKGEQTNANEPAIHRCDANEESTALPPVGPNNAALLPPPSAPPALPSTAPSSPPTSAKASASESAATSDPTAATNGAEATAEETSTTANGEDAAKPKPRRRCSDLHFLEQWGWHKSRRYSSRKKTQTERVETDTTLNGFLKRIFPKFTETTFDGEWPFAEQLEANVKPENGDDGKNNNSCAGGEEAPCKCKNVLSMEEFHHETRQHFERFIRKLQAKQFDLMVLIYKWLKYMSYCGNKRVPDALRAMYLQMFNCYLNHFDFSTWNQLTNNNFEASFSICVLFLEFNLSHASERNSELAETWQSVFKHLLFNSGCAYVAFTEHYNNLYKLRLINLEYLWCEQRQQLDHSLSCLLQIEEMLHDIQPTETAGDAGADESSENASELHLPNLESFCLSRQRVEATRVQLQQQIELKKVPSLFEARQWPQLAAIIKQNVLNCSDYRTENERDNWIRDFKTQVEILLESLWQMGEYEDCLHWSEKFLHYVTWQYLKQQAKSALRQKAWAESINYIMSYLEALVLNEGFDFLNHLDVSLSRLVQNIIRLVVHQLDAPFDKNNNPVHDLETKRPWVVLHHVAMREETANPVEVRVKKSSADSEDDEDLMPNALSLLFTAHDFLGKRQWCSRDNSALLNYILEAVAPTLRAPPYESCRDVIYEHMEQVTYCLYGYPQKKARSRHLEDHEAVPIELNWPKAVLIFDLYRPECLPEFNSYKLESISADMEQLLLKIIGLFPTELDQVPATTIITNFINGECGPLGNDKLTLQGPQLPLKMNSLYYLLGDYYFKNRDFSKTLKYYTLDLTFNPDRFDSWAGMALSKASKIETKLNALTPMRLAVLLSECEESLRCFERCITLNSKQTLLWIEYGSFAYTIHSFCSRFLKQPANEILPEEKILADERKGRMLDTASNCFSIAARLQSHAVEPVEDDGDIHDEKWLCQFMLGKIAEKRHEHPKVYLNYYLTAANYLYESNATYPIKINHSSPTTLSVEALEVFYRTNSVVIKHLENNAEITRELGNLFSDVLGNLAKSPFAFNKAKIDGNSLNALKRKNPEKPDPNTVKLPKHPEPKEQPAVGVETASATAEEATNLPPRQVELKPAKDDVVSPTRRESQESANTGTTTTITSSTTSSTSSSDSSTSDSDTDSDVSGQQGKANGSGATYSVKELEELYKIVIHNLEECVTRFPEHYKSIYRLGYHYMNAPEKLRAVKRCEELLLGQYRTTLGNQINGLFYDRKTNNLFNGIWRIPSSEIDRPGSFPAHLVKCVRMLIDMLMKSGNHRILIDIGLQLYKTPDADKRYIKDNERCELYQQSIGFTAQILRGILQKNMQPLQRNDTELLDLLLDIYKIHKKCVKYMSQKEPLFTQLLVEVYKFYILDKVDCMLEHLNFLELAIKLCLQEISMRKNLEKSQNQPNGSGTIGSLGSGAMSGGDSSNLGDVLLGFNTVPNAGAATVAAPPGGQRIVHIPGLPPRMRQRLFSGGGGLSKPILPSLPTIDGLRPTFGGTTGAPSLAVASSAIITDVLQSPNVMSMISSLNASAIVQSDTVGFQKLVAEYYKQFMERANLPVTSIPSMLTMSTATPATNVQSTFPLVTSLPMETTITPAPAAATRPTPTIDLSGGPSAIAPLPTTAVPHLPTFDLTITPAIIKSSMAGVSSASTLPLAKPTVGGINMLKYPSKLADLPVSLTITSLTKAQLAVGMGSSTGLGTAVTNTDGNFAGGEPTGSPSSGRYTAKAKAAPKGGRPATAKPYNRNAANSAPTDGSTFNTQQQQIMAAYADLLKSSSLGRATTTTSTSISLGDGSLTASTVAAAQRQPSKSKAPPDLSPASSTTVTSQSQKPFAGYPAFSTNSITMTALPKRGSPTPTSIFNSSPSHSAKAVTPPTVSAATITATFPLQVTATASSPTKTLQQKLAERQKAANQINDLVGATGSAPSGVGRPETMPSPAADSDVIILD